MKGGNMKLKEVPILSRPRERLINQGVESLSDVELLAILLKTGTKEMSCQELAIQLLQQIQSVKRLKEISLETLTSIKGIGSAKACEILAAIELGKRLGSKDSIKKITIKNSSNIYDYYKYVLKDKKQEHFYCIYLDSKNKIIKDKLLYVGTLNESLVHPRDVFKEAYLVNACSLICIHNHPSGDVTPSLRDVELTKNLKQVGEILGIRVLDHIIIGEEDYYGFLENGMI